MCEIVLLRTRASVSGGLAFRFNQKLKYAWILVKIRISPKRESKLEKRKRETV